MYFNFSEMNYYYENNYYREKNGKLMSMAVELVDVEIPFGPRTL